jgi:hypothetical protein
MPRGELPLKRQRFESQSPSFVQMPPSPFPDDSSLEGGSVGFVSLDLSPLDLSPR